MLTPHQIKPANLFVILALCFLSSCVFLSEGSVNDFVNENNFLNRFPENQKSIVIVKIAGSSASKVLWCDQKNIIEPSPDNCFWIYAGDTYHILMLKPGNYYLLKYFRKHPPLFSSIDESHNQMRYFTSFSVKPGQISYLGDLAMKGSAGKEYDQEDKNIISDNGDVIVRDNFENLRDLLNNKNPKKTDRAFANQPWEKNYLVKEYPNLKNLLVKRLVKNVKLKDNSTKPKNITIDL